MRKTICRKNTSNLLLFCVIILLTFAPSCAARSSVSEFDFKGTTSSERLSEYFAYLKECGEITEDYPDYYGGMYYDNNTLCVVVTDRSRKTEKLIREISGSDTLKIVYGSASLNELLREQNLMIEKWAPILDSYNVNPEDLDSEELLLFENLVASEVSESDNNIKVYFTSNDHALEDVFREHISDYKNVEFIYPEDIESE